MVTRDVAPAIIFLVLYTCLFIFLTRLYVLRKILFRSRYSFIYFHVTLRLAGQACGIAFSVMSWTDFTPRLNVLIAYLVFNAEGYFSLILCTYRFLIVWQRSRLGNSWIEPNLPKTTPLRERLLGMTPMRAIEYVLAGANGIIIAGGSILSQGLEKEGQGEKVGTGKALRVAGTALFLALVQVFLVFAARDWRRKGDRTLVAIMLTWPLLTIRGAYGIVSVEMPQYSYYNPNVYTDTGLSTKFLVAEYVLGTVMEFCACCLLLSTYFAGVVGGERMEEVGRERDAEENDGAGEEMQLNDRVKGV